MLPVGADVKNVRDTRWNMTGHNYELTWRQNTEVIIKERNSSGKVRHLYKTYFFQISWHTLVCFKYQRNILTAASTFGSAKFEERKL